MKKVVLLFLLTVLLVTIPTVNTYAQSLNADNNSNTLLDDEHSSISVGALDGDISEKDLEEFLDFLNGDAQIEARSICLIHDYVYVGAVFSITHKVYESQPRCVEETYYLYECSKCGARKYVLISTRRIICCS